MSKRLGNIIVLSAPSGSGKTTVLQRALDAIDEIEFSISYTTRTRRSTEQDGVDYHFITAEDFERKVERGDFLEWAKVHGNFYGTGRADAEAICAEGRDVMLDVDVQGADQVRRAKHDAVSVFMLPPSFEVLEERLRGRRSDDPEHIEVRLEAARKEIDRYREYDYVIINEDIDRSAELLRSIILAERTRPRLIQEVIRPIFDSFR
jgi:guanylate kinase